MTDEVIGCSVCHRALHAKDADKQGRCVDCRSATTPARDTAPANQSEPEPPTP